MDELQWQQKAVREVGDSSSGAIFEVALPVSTSGGNWLASANGVPSAALDAFISADGLHSALQQVGTIGAGNIRVFGMPLGPFTVELVGALAGQVVPDGWLVADGTNLIPQGAITAVRIRQGRLQSLSQLAAEYWELFPNDGDYLRHLRVKVELLKTELGRASGRYDGRDGDAEAKESQWFNQLRLLKRDADAEVASFQTVNTSRANGQTLSGTIIAGQNAVNAFEARKFYGDSTFPFGRNNGY